MSRESAGMRRWGWGWSDTSPVRGCVSEQINQQWDGSARSCVTEISLVVVFCLRLYCAPPANTANAERADTHQGA